MRSIVKSIYEHSLKTPDKIAVITEAGIINYQAFWHCIAGASHLLRKKYS